MKKIIDTLATGGAEYTVALLDSDCLAALCEAEKICFPEDAWTAGMLADTLKSESTAVLGVYNRQMSEIAAYGVLYAVADEADIANIAVLPAFRRQGLGRELLKKMVGFARRAGALRIFLEVRESNAAAIGLYEKLGFEKIGKRRNYYFNPREDALIMMLGENAQRL